MLVDPNNLKSEDLFSIENYSKEYSENPIVADLYDYFELEIDYYQDDGKHHLYVSVNMEFDPIIENIFSYLSLRGPADGLTHYFGTKSTWSKAHLDREYKRLIEYLIEERHDLDVPLQGILVGTWRSEARA